MYLGPPSIKPQVSLVVIGFASGLVLAPFLFLSSVVYCRSWRTELVLRDIGPSKRDKHPNTEERCKKKNVIPAGRSFSRITHMVIELSARNVIDPLLHVIVRSSMRNVQSLRVMVGQSCLRRGVELLYRAIPAITTAPTTFVSRVIPSLPK